MIFVTVGTILPFDRLSAAVDDWTRTSSRGVPVFGQLYDLGTHNYRPEHFEWVERLSPDDFRDRIAKAKIIVTHAGVGTIIEALMHAKPLLIMPRRHALREVVNDHQLETVAKFRNRPGIRIAMEANEIAPAIEALLDTANNLPSLSPYAEPKLTRAIRSFIFNN